MFKPRFVPCAACGTTVDRGTSDVHRCDTDQLVDRIMDLLAQAPERIDLELRQYLATPEGRQERWWAIKEVRRARP